MRLIAWREEGDRLDTQLISIFSDWRWDMICVWWSFKTRPAAWRLWIRRRSLMYRAEVNKPAFDIECGVITLGDMRRG